MPNVIPTKTPFDVPPVKDHRPLDHPVVPPDDPNADRQDRRPDIDPPPTDPPLRAPSENPGVVEPPARACTEWSDAWPPQPRSRRAQDRPSIAAFLAAHSLLSASPAAYELLP
jgi:hypothetical protein